MASPFREGHPAASDSPAFTHRPSPPDTGGLPSRPTPAPPRLPSPQDSLLPPTAPEVGRSTRPSPAPPVPRSQKESPGRSPTREEERFAARRALPSPQKEQPRRFPTWEDERFVAGRSPVPRLPTPPEDSVVVRSPAREEERFAAGRAPVARLPSPQEEQPGRFPTWEDERFVAGRNPVPRLPTPPEDSVVVRSPAREEDRSTRPSHVPRLASLLLQESPARSPAHEAGGAAGPALVSPRKESPPLDGGSPPLPPAHTEPIENPSSRTTSILNRAARDDQPAVTKVERGVDAPEAERGSKVVSWILKRRRRGEAVGRAAIGVRLSAMVLSLVSFSMMAADKTKGWAGDSFDRYREYRFCITINILTFVYSGFQAYAEAHRLIYEEDIIRSPWRYYFDFAMDQVLAYLLMAASSAAATRTDDWVSNWGSDPFTVMANGSTAVSYLAFVAVAVSALISAHALFGRRS